MVDDKHTYFSGASKEVDEMIAKGDVDIVFASPEALVGDKDWRSIIQEFAVSLIVIDEFHTVATWYVASMLSKFLCDHIKGIEVSV